MQRKIMAQRSKNVFIFLWIACGGLAILAGGVGRTSQGQPFFAVFDSLLQNLFYGLGVILYALIVGWLLAKVVQRVIEKIGS